MFVSIALTHFEVNIFLKKKEKISRARLHITSHPKRMCSCVVISTGFIFEYILLSSSTTKYMEVGPHHSSP